MASCPRKQKATISKRPILMLAGRHQIGIPRAGRPPINQCKEATSAIEAQLETTAFANRLDMLIKIKGMNTMIVYFAMVTWFWVIWTKFVWANPIRRAKTNSTCWAITCG